MEAVIVGLVVFVLALVAAVVMLYFELCDVAYLAKQADNRAWDTRARLREEIKRRKQRDQQLAELFGGKARE